MRNMWSLISYLGRAQPPLSTLLLLIFWNFCPQGMNSDCDGHLPPILICDELLLIFPVTCGRNHHQSWVISAFCISYLFSWAVPAPCTLHAPGEALPHQCRGLPWCTPTAPSPTPSSGLVIKCSEHTGLCSPVLQQ